MEHQPAPATPRGGSWGNAFVLLLVVAFIVYGSLYPFRDEALHPLAALRHLLGSWRDWDRRGDLVANIALYMPLGFFLVQSLPRRLPAATCVLLGALLGAVLASCVEFLQFADPVRVSTLGDVYANAIGGALGGLVALYAGDRWRWPLLTECQTRPDAVLLLLLFLGFQLFPFVPIIGLYKYWHAVRDLVETPLPSAPALIQFVAFWLLAAACIEALFGSRWWWLLFPLFAAAEFTGRILVVNVWMDWADVLGAVLALILWGTTAFVGVWRTRTLTALFIGVMLAWQIDPAAFRITGIHPLLRQELMRGAAATLPPALCERLVLYGGSIWLLRRSGVSAVVSITGVCLLLLLTSLAGSSVADALLALVIGVVLDLLHRVGSQSGLRADAA